MRYSLIIWTKEFRVNLRIIWKRGGSTLVWHSSFQIWLNGRNKSKLLSLFHYCPMVLRRRKEGNADLVSSHAYTENTSHGSRVLRSSSNSKTNHKLSGSLFSSSSFNNLLQIHNSHLFFVRLLFDDSFSLFSRRSALPSSSPRILSTSMHLDRLERERKDTCRVAKSTIFFSLPM